MNIAGPATAQKVVTTPITITNTACPTCFLEQTTSTKASALVHALVVTGGFLTAFRVKSVVIGVSNALEEADKRHVTALVGLQDKSSNTAEKR